MKDSILEFIVEHVFKAHWIVNAEGKMGIRVLGINMWYFKWPEPMVNNTGWWREVRKREFGETVDSIRGEK